MSHSSAYQAFESNRADVDRLLEVHRDLSGKGRGRRYGMAVLNKSAVVLLCAAWEAYCEDLVSEVVEHFVSQAPEAKILPTVLRKRIATELSSDKMQMWTLAGDGWRLVLSKRLGDLKVERDRKLNTPRTSQIRELFAEHVGYDNIDQKWTWSGVTAELAREKLDEFVTLRGSIAHRVEADSAVHKADVVRYTRFIGRLVKNTDQVIVEHARSVTGLPLA